MAKIRGNLDAWLQRLSALASTGIIEHTVNRIAARALQPEDIALYMNAVRDGAEVIKGQIEKVRRIAGKKKYEDILAVFGEEIEYGMDFSNMGKKQ